MRKSKKEEENRFRSHLVNTDCHNGGVVVEKRNYPGAGYPEDSSESLRRNYRRKNSETGTFKSSFVVSGAKVLANEGGYCHCKRHYRNEDESFDFGIGTAAGHCGISESVYVGLDHNVGYGNDGVVDSGRDSLMKNFFKPYEIETNLAEMELIITFALKKFSETQNRRKQLAYNGCNCRAGNAEIENSYENKVKDDVR